MKAAALAILLAASLTAAAEITDTEIGELGALVETGSPEEVIGWISGYSLEQRIELYGIAREFYVFNSFPGQNLNDLIAVSEHAIEDMLAASRSQDSELRSRALLDQASTFSFNLSADLAECWPGDTLTRTDAHFEKGLEAALHSLEWSHYLEKDDESFFMAFWAAGMHQLSLGMTERAVYSLVNSLNRAEQMAVDSGIQLGFHPGAGFDMLLAHGYLGLAFLQSGEGSEHFDGTIELLQEGMELYPELGQDYQFAIDQLMWAKAMLEL